MSNTIHLNVGGTYFETTRSTLSGSEYFEIMFNGPWIDSKKGLTKENAIFIDRDPDNFKHVLSYLRDISHCFPRRLSYELDFFQIPHNFPDVNAICCQISSDMRNSLPPKLSRRDGDRNRNRDDNFHMLLSKSSTTGVQLSGIAFQSSFIQMVSMEPNCTKYFGMIPIGKNTFVTYPDNQIYPNKLIRYRIPRSWDMISELYLDISYTGETKLELRYELIRQIQVIYGDNILSELTGYQLMIYEHLNKPLFKYEHDLLMDQIQHNILLCIPIYPILAQDYYELEIKVEFNDLAHYENNIKLVNANINGNTLLFQRTDLKKILEKEPQRIVLQYSGDYNIIFNSSNTNIYQFQITNSLNSRTRRLYFYIASTQTPLEPINIESFQLYVNNSIIISLKERQILEEMANKGIYPAKAVYWVSFEPGYMDFTRVDNVRLQLTFNENLIESQYELHLLDENYNIVTNNNPIFH
jgi:hypothetical protein